MSLSILQYIVAMCDPYRKVVRMGKTFDSFVHCVDLHFETLQQMETTCSKEDLCLFQTSTNDQSLTSPFFFNTLPNCVLTMLPEPLLYHSQLLVQSSSTCQADEFLDLLRVEDS